MKLEYYNTDELYSKTDLDGKKPFMYMITSNRSAGKTTCFLLESLENFRNNKKKTCLIYRYSYELNSCSDIYKDVLNMYEDYGKEMTCLSHAKGLFYELFLDGESFGYAISLSNPDSLKKYSPIFADVTLIIFDEFQLESGRYLSKEVDRFQSVLVTICRGGGEQSREVKVIMLGNRVSILNPYFILFGIHKRLKENTRFLRGHGWIAQFDYNKSASKALKDNRLMTCFTSAENNDFMQYCGEDIYLHDTSAFIGKLSGKSKYIATIIHNGNKYGIREFLDSGLLYISSKADNSCKFIVTYQADNHNQNTIMMNRYSWLTKYLRECFNIGSLRFEDLRAKDVIYDILAVDIYK